MGVNEWEQQIVENGRWRNRKENTLHLATKYIEPIGNEKVYKKGNCQSHIQLLAMEFLNIFRRGTKKDSSEVAQRAILDSLAL